MPDCDLNGVALYQCKQWRARLIFRSKSSNTLLCMCLLENGVYPNIELNSRIDPLLDELVGDED